MWEGGGTSEVQKLWQSFALFHLLSYHIWKAKLHGTSNSPAQLTSNCLSANILILSLTKTKAAFFFSFHREPAKFWIRNNLTFFFPRRARWSANLGRINRKRWQDVTTVVVGETGVTWLLVISCFDEVTNVRQILDSHERWMGMLRQN